MADDRPPPSISHFIMPFQKIPLRLPTTFLGIVLGTAGCGTSAGDDTVAVVEFTDVFVEERTVVLEQDSMDLLGSPGSVLRWGEFLAVLDDMQGNIKVYDGNGRLRRTIGRPGHGPGEFRSPRYGAVTEDGGMLVFDQFTQEVTRLDPAGNFARRSPSPVPWLGSISTFAGGVLASGYSSGALAGAEPGAVFAPLHALDTAGVVIRAFGEMRVEQRPELRMMGEVLAHVVSDSLVVFGRRSSASISLVDPASGSQRTVRGSPPGYSEPTLPRQPLADMSAAREWSNAHTWLSGFLGGVDEHFVARFSGPAPGGGRMHTYTVLNGEGRRVVSTRPTERYLRSLDARTYYHLAIEDEGAILTLFHMEIAGDDAPLAVLRRVAR